MTDFEVRITTLGATAFGTGDGKAGVIDRDTLHDSYGLPFVGGRRVKGLLRESAEEVWEILEAFATRRDTHLMPVEELFGKPGSSVRSILSLDDARLPQSEELTEWLDFLQSDITAIAARSYFHTEAVLQTYTEFRTQTKIDPRTGSPDENTLRTTRLLQPQQTRHTGSIPAAHNTPPHYALVAATTDTDRQRANLLHGHR